MTTTTTTSGDTKEDWLNLCPVTDDAESGFFEDLLLKKGIPREALKRNETGLLITRQYFDASRQALKDNEKLRRSESFSPFKLVDHISTILFPCMGLASFWLVFLRFRRDWWPLIQRIFISEPLPHTTSIHTDHPIHVNLTSGIAIVIMILSVVFVYPRLSQWLKRRRATSKPFPESWQSVFEAMPFYDNLTETDRIELKKSIQIFLVEKSFEACAGARVTHRIQILIASTACLLLLRRKTDIYPTVQTILVYPTTFEAGHRSHLGGGVYLEGTTELIGQAWKTGSVILAMDQIERDALKWKDGNNVVLHEFAHQLDAEDGQFDGVPCLAKKEHYPAWAKHFTKAFRDLQAEVSEDRVALNSYAGTNPAEFFAVATECFFEQPNSMSKRFPAVYDDLKRFYKQDPVEWTIKT